MNNILELLDKDVDHMDDVKTLKEKIPILAMLSNRDVEYLYREYSDQYSAGWMMFHEKDNGWAEDSWESFKRFLEI